jgi:hypothetical protein
MPKCENRWRKQSLRGTWARATPITFPTGATVGTPTRVGPAANGKIAQLRCDTVREPDLTDSMVLSEPDPRTSESSSPNERLEDLEDHARNLVTILIVGGANRKTQAFESKTEFPVV